MDNIDRKIVRELQMNARLTNQELADRVNLSPSPCLRRVRKLEKSGVLTGYTAGFARRLMAVGDCICQRQAGKTKRYFDEGI